MRNSKKIAEKFFYKYLDSHGPNWLSGYPDIIEILYEYGISLETRKDKLNKLNSMKNE